MYESLVRWTLSTGFMFGIWLLWSIRIVWFRPSIIDGQTWSRNGSYYLPIIDRSLAHHLQSTTDSWVKKKPLWYTCLLALSRNCESYTQIRVKRHKLVVAPPLVSRVSLTLSTHARLCLFIPCCEHTINLPRVTRSCACRFARYCYCLLWDVSMLKILSTYRCVVRDCVWVHVLRSSLARHTKVCSGASDASLRTSFFNKINNSAKPRPSSCAFKFMIEACAQLI